MDIFILYVLDIVALLTLLPSLLGMIFLVVDLFPFSLRKQKRKKE